jgi:hypothetical protein
MASDGALPIVTFGKYKGRPVTDMLADKKYVEWCKQQEFFKNHTTIYNICVNQTIGSQPSKTPEHNRMQNLFLDNKRVALLLARSLTADEDHATYLVERFINRDLRVEFEGKFNWDIIIGGTCYTPYKCTNSWAVSTVAFKSTKKTCASEGKCICSNRVGSTYIEIKPLVGDDYPTILRKMNTQKEITLKTEGRASQRFLLLIKDYQSSTTTNDELIQIFKQSDIHVLFLADLFPTLSPSLPVQRVAPLEIQMDQPSSSSDDRIDILERRIARLESLLVGMGLADE